MSSRVGPGSDPSWIKRSLSVSNGNCVEVANFPGGEVCVRQQGLPKGPVLRFTLAEWYAFLGGV